ncbi:MAG: Zn-dependent protease with chaperone function [Gammaproteobacteria bacterium]|jgi:Zn-dependent protease with chaperone function
MNFFEAQERAHKNTGKLILLFTLAIIGLVILTNILMLFAYTWITTEQLDFSITSLMNRYSWQETAIVSAGVVGLILLGSFHKTLSLAGGGAVVAESLGGRLIPQNTSDLQQKQLLNVVEEMAIAAGMPIPKVYLLDDNAINAFAAGKTPANAVIGMTRGSLEQLNREELQGVIAHEFSHIANGDMRLNIRLIGILHGILLIGMIGYIILRAAGSGRRSSSRKSSGGAAAFFALGAGLMVIGYAGSFFGQWIKAIVSRQREYLADSAAVQFTRNQDGIAGALKKIGGGSVSRSHLSASSAAEYSHAYFANGVSSMMQSILATHPPLNDRIKRIDPQWDGQFITFIAKPNVESQSSSSNPSSDRSAPKIPALDFTELAIAGIGSLNESNVSYVQELIIGIPPILREAASDPYSARALIYAVLVSFQKDGNAPLQTFELEVDSTILQLTEKYSGALKKLSPEHRLPLLELATNALKELSPNQYIQFNKVVMKIMQSDKIISLNEWVFQRFVIQQLDLFFDFKKMESAKYSSLTQVSNEVRLLLSLIANIEHKNKLEAEQAWKKGLSIANLDGSGVIDNSLLKINHLNDALNQLMLLKPLTKPKFLRACLAVIMHDEIPTIRGIELIRMISSCLDCPMPPLKVK